MTTLNIPVTAPIASARVTTAVTRKPGVRSSDRQEWRRSVIQAASMTSSRDGLFLGRPNRGIGWRARLQRYLTGDERSPHFARRGTLRPKTRRHSRFRRRRLYPPVLPLVWDGERSVIGALGPDHDENRAFLSFAKAFRGAGLPVPEIFAEDQDEGAWLEEDLGDITLFRALSDARAEQEGDEFPAAIVPLYRRVLEVLPRFQVEGHRVVDYRPRLPAPPFDEQSIRWDLNYFKYHFLKLAHIPFNEQRLEDDFTDSRRGCSRPRPKASCTATSNRETS